MYGKSHLVIIISYQTFDFKNEFSRVNRFDSVRNSAIHPTKISGDSVIPYRSFGGLVCSETDQLQVAFEHSRFSSKHCGDFAQRLIGKETYGLGDPP